MTILFYGKNTERNSKPFVEPQSYDRRRAVQEASKRFIAENRDAILRYASPAARIIAQTARKHGFTVEQIRGDGLSRKLVAARHDCVELIYRDDPTKPLAKIGRMVRLDRTTVRYVLKKRGLIV